MWPSSRLPAAARRARCTPCGCATGAHPASPPWWRPFARRSPVSETRAMGIYGDHVLPRMINCRCGLKMNDPLRERTCEGLEGEVIEIGFGSGLNIPFYPAGVTRVAAVGPAGLGRKVDPHAVGALRV